MKFVLPIDEVLPRIVEGLIASNAMIVVAEPGAGKTTHVPPALLDITKKQIILLQPRRVAARAAASRISEEMGTILGEEIGYLVRHESHFKLDTRILVCTEGIFLRKLQEDPSLENVGIVIFDEFHERSLDSDLALALVHQVKKELRSDLKIVVMSATLDAEPVSRYLDNCPIIKSKGRNFPVDIEYLSFPPRSRIEERVCDGVKRMLDSTSGHILAFLPGVREVHATRGLLESAINREDILLLPLYGDMPLEEQHRAMSESGKNKRKVVLATNVAETSITINGITAVVDSGMARVNRLDPRLGLNSLILERISKASADQRAGRAGRTEGGTCLRLWSEREQQSMDEFNKPEIERVELSECILQLFAWGEKDVMSFPWFSPPPQVSLKRAIELLEWLDATRDGTLTEDGRYMSHLPLQPRMARLLIEGARLGQTRKAAICASLLSGRDIIKRSNEPEKRGALHRSDSDILDRVFLINQFEEKGLRNSYLGEISARQAKQVIQDAEQLERLMKPLKIESVKSVSEDEALMRALVTAYCDRLCRRREPGKNTALMVGGRGVRLADESAVTEAELFLAIELVETGKSDALVRQASSVQKNWLPESHLSNSVEVEYDFSRSKVVAFKRTRFLDLLIEENVTALPPDIDTGATLAEGLLKQGADLSSLVDEETKEFLARIVCLQEAVPELNLPELSSQPWLEYLAEWCSGLSSLDEMKSRSLLSVIQGRLTYEQIMTINREAPAKMEIPSGSQIKLVYEVGKPPVLAARIQELFGMTQTPRIAKSRVPVLVHLLAPNFRVQQITPDLESFWKNTYAQVRKDFKARYPKHSWPEDPLTAKAERGPKRKH